jgi:hypothetical protein
MHEKRHPELLLIEALRIDRAHLSNLATRWIEEFSRVGECGLAYDVFLDEMEAGAYRPSGEALALIVEAASVMGIQYPAKSSS